MNALDNVSLSEEEKNKLLNNNGLSSSNLLIPKVYAPMFNGSSRKYILSSGRLSGKTSILVAKWWERINKYQDRDIVILQATSTEIKDSIINEIEKFLRNSGFDVGDDPHCEWYIPKAHDRVTHKGQIGGTYFFPITDSNGGQRSRGINTKNKLSLVMYEEAQKNLNANVLEQSLITFIRQVDDDAQIIIVGNSETAGHWFVDFVEEKRKDSEWYYIYSCCYDIWGLLNEQTRNYVANFKKNNYTEFRRIYLGDIHASTSDVVFPQFAREKHYKKVFELEQHQIVTIIFGCDHATANDTFAIVPVAILDDGTTQTLEICYDDPEETNRTLAPTEQCEIFDDFLNWMDEKYGLVYNKVEVLISVDGAASAFIAQLRHTQKTSDHKEIWRWAKIKGFTKKKKEQNLTIIKNAFAYDVLTILNEGTRLWDGSRNTHRLAKEIEAQRYKNGKLNGAIKNDLCDALEYGLIPYYTNCYNVSYPVRVKKHLDDILRASNLIK